MPRLKLSPLASNCIPVYGDFIFFFHFPFQFTPDLDLKHKLSTKV